MSLKNGVLRVTNLHRIAARVLMWSLVSINMDLRCVWGPHGLIMVTREWNWVVNWYKDKHPVLYKGCQCFEEVCIISCHSWFSHLVLDQIVGIQMRHRPRTIMPFTATHWSQTEDHAKHIHTPLHCRKTWLWSRLVSATSRSTLRMCICLEYQWSLLSTPSRQTRRPSWSWCSRRARRQEHLMQL